MTIYRQWSGLGQSVISPIIRWAVLIVTVSSGSATCTRTWAEERPSLAVRMQQPLKFNFGGESLSAAMSALSVNDGIPITDDWRSLAEANLSWTEISVTASDQGQPLGAALKRVLQPHGLTWIERHDIVVITTVAAATQSYLVPSVYLMTQRVPPDRRLRSIMWGVAEESWANVGGPGDGAPLPPDVVVILQSPAIHELIAAKFEKSILPVRGAQLEAPNSSVIERALAKPAVVNFHDVRLVEALRDCGERYGVSISIDTVSLEAAGVGDDIAIDLQLGEVSSLASGLSILLERAHADLTWVVADSQILITTKEAAKNHVSKVIYDCHDIVPEGGASVLLDAIQFTISPESWEDVGGDGVIALGVDEKTLEITQDATIHRRLQRLFADLRAARAARP